MAYKDDAIENPIVQYNLFKKFIEIRGLQDKIRRALKVSPSFGNKNKRKIFEIPLKPLDITDLEMANLRFIDLLIDWSGTYEGFEFWFKEYCLFLLNCLFLFPNNIKLRKYVYFRIMDKLKYEPYDMLPLLNKANFIFKN